METLHNKLVYALIMANIFDIFATKILLDSGQFYEVNGIVCYLMDRHGYITGVALPKFFLSFAFVYGLYLQNSNKTIIFFLMIAVSAYVCVAIWHAICIMSVLFV
jgi:hypothetical protein